MKPKKSKKRKVLLGRVYDLLLIPIYLCTAILFLFGVFSYTRKYILPLLAILLILLALYIAVMLYNKMILHVIRRVLMTLLCVTLLFGYTKIQSFNSFFDDITNNEDTYVTTQMDLYSLQSNEYYTAVATEYKDIEGLVVGIQNKNDNNASQYVVEKMKNDFDEFDVMEYKDYNTMISDLTNGYIDVAVVNSSKQSGLEEIFGPFADYTHKLQSFTYKEKVTVNTNDLDITEEPFTVLLSGTDEIGSPADASKSDMNMLVMINPKTAQITTVSIPRDAYLPNPAYDYQNDKFTHTGNDGIDNTIAAIEYALDIKVDFYAKVSFSSIINIVDTLGGVEVNVPIYIEEQDENRSFDPEDMIHLNPGVQVLDGRQTLAFARHRNGYEDGDLGRNAAQMQIIKAIIRKLMTPEGISRIDDVLKIVPDYVLMNFSNSQLKNFIQKQVDEMPDWKITSLSLADIQDEPNAIVASMPDVYTWSCYLAQYQVESVHAAYVMMKEGISFHDFSFTLDSLYLDAIDFTPKENVLFH